MNDTITNTKRPAGTAHGAIDDDFIYLTKRIHLPRASILAVKPTRDGDGATIVTDRGATRVCEDYSALMYHLYGVDVAASEGGAR